MNKRRFLLTAIVVAILGALIYLQVRQWQHFDWVTFRRATSGIDPANIAIALALIFIAYGLRAVRWQMLMRPVRQVPLGRLIGPQIIGFTGLAILGRPGELVRPYLISRKENVPLASQMAVWTVERIFDIGAFTVLMSIDLFGFASHLQIIREGAHPEWLWRLYLAGSVLIGIVAVLALGAWAVRRHGEALAHWTEAHVAKFAPRFGLALRHKIISFREGLETITSVSELVQVTFVSLVIWAMIAVAYREIIHSYPAAIGGKLTNLDFPDVLLLMAASMAGSMLQLPAVGGGSQLATISMMNNWFGIPQEVAVSCGMMLWLVTFMAVIPVGLAWAHFERISLRSVAHETADTKAPVG